MIAAGLGYRAPNVVGAGLAVAGLPPLALSAVLRRRGVHELLVRSAAPAAVAAARVGAAR